MVELKKIFDEINLSASTIYKKEILNKYRENIDFKTLLQFLLNPYIVAGISQKKINKNVFKKPTIEFKDFFEMLQYIKTNNTGSDEVIANIHQFLDKCDIEVVDFLKSIITKSLRIGCDIKTVNKVYGSEFIPLWQVQQSYSFKDTTLQEDEWFNLSEKLNGVRGTFYKNKLISRQGKIFQGLEHILTDIQQLSFLNEVVLDGELIRKNIDNISDNESFRLGAGILNSDDGNKASIKFIIFDVLPQDEFEKGISSLTYKERMIEIANLNNAIKNLDLENIEVVKNFYSGTDKSKIEFYLNIIVEEGKEGLMLNRDYPYQCKRHLGILKIKQFYTVDLQIIKVEEGTGRLKGMLGAFVVNYKGNELNVGTGMTDENRVEFWNNREFLIGRVIEVKYKEVSCDKDTLKESLQFPVFVQLREEGKEESYS